MKLCRQLVHKKDNTKNKNFVVKAIVSIPDPFQGFHDMHFIYLPL